MAGSNLGIGLGERGLSLFPSRPGGGLGLKTTSFALKTYTADRFGTAEGIGGRGSYIYQLPGGLHDNNLFSIEANTGVLSTPHPILETNVTKHLTIRVTDTAANDVADIPATVNVTGTILKWNVTTLSTNPGGLTNWVGDGATNNNIAIDNMRARMLAAQTADPNVAFEITIPAGLYSHNNRAAMFRGIRRYRLIGAGPSETTGSRIRNTGSNGSWYGEVPFITNLDPWMRVGGRDNPFIWTYGTRIQTANVGATTITLAENVSSGHLQGNAAAVGKRVQISSGLSSVFPGSYPTHMENIEWPKIAAITGTSSGDVITLDRPLLYTHHTDGPAVASDIDGRAQVLFFDQDYSTTGGTWYPGTECVVIEGIRFNRNPNWTLTPITDEETQIFGAFYARMTDCHNWSMGLQLVDTFVMQNTTVDHHSEPDTCLRQQFIHGCTLNGGWWGPNVTGSRTEVTNTTFNASGMKMGMGELLIDNCTFNMWAGGNVDYYTIFETQHIGAVKLFQITNSTFNYTSGNGFAFGGIVNEDLTVGTDITYAADVVTAAYQSPATNTPWDWVCSRGTRVSYLDSGKPQWGTLTGKRSDGTIAGIAQATIVWDAGSSGSGISTGTALRFYKIANLVFDNVTFRGWSNESQILANRAHGAANHDFYRRAGQAVPSSVWNITLAP